MNFKSLLERPALLLDHPAGGADNLSGFIAKKLRFDIFDDWTFRAPAVKAAAAKNRAGLAKQQADEMGIVNMQIDQRASGR